MALNYNGQEISSLKYHDQEILGGSSGIESLDKADETVEVQFTYAKSSGTNPTLYTDTIYFYRFGNMVLYDASFKSTKLFSIDSSKYTPTFSSGLPNRMKPVETEYLCMMSGAPGTAGYIRLNTNGSFSYQRPVSGTTAFSNVAYMSGYNLIGFYFTV